MVHASLRGWQLPYTFEPPAVTWTEVLARPPPLRLFSRRGLPTPAPIREGEIVALRLELRVIVTLKSCDCFSRFTRNSWTISGSGLSTISLKPFGMVMTAG